MKDEVNWLKWYNMTRGQAPNKLLVEALSYVENTGKIIDIGGGALRDAKFLLQKGFEVTVIDKSPLLKKEAVKINNELLHPVVISFEDFQFPADEYVLASAMQSLSYCEREHFGRVIMSIKSSLKKGGVFCGQIYDRYDEWSKSPQTRRHHKSCYTAKEAKKYLDDMEIVLFQEEETDRGRTKHWHIYNFIARK